MGNGGGSPKGDRNHSPSLAAQNRNENMSSSNPAEIPSKGPAKKRRFLTAEKKFQIYLEAQTSDKPIGELLRREGLYSTDLARIRQQVRDGAIQRLGLKPGRKQAEAKVQAQLARLELLNRITRAIAERQNLRSIFQVVIRSL
jgi:transposase-like protein